MSANPPIRRKDFDTQGFLAFVAEQGGEVGTPTNSYEVVRYRAYWRGTNTSAVHIVYAKENGLLTWCGGSLGHYRAFLAGEPMEQLPVIAKPAKPEQPAVSKGQSLRNKLRERDGNGCWFCGEEMTPFEETIEHLIPRSKGGRDTLANYALAHSKCNNDAADLPLVDKIAMRARLLAERERSDAR